LSDPLRTLLDKDQIVEVLNRLFLATDRRDWSEVRACLADQVLFDMSSLGAGPATSLTPQQIADAWESGLRPIQAIHHQAGNYRVTLAGRQATASCYGIAYHYRPVRSGRNTRVFVGSYDFHLVSGAAGWRIDQFRFNLKFLDGNRELDQEPPPA
jgi:hypothetical protein